MTLSAQAGGLHHCRELEIYKADPDLVDDTYYRLRSVFVAYQASGDQDKVDQAQMSYSVYKQALQQGAVTLVDVPTEGNPEAKFRLITIPVEGVDMCKAFETEVMKAREPNGFLDVKPNYGADGLKNRT